MELTRTIPEEAFDDLGRMSRERGFVSEIAVYGGACLLLATDIRDVTRDVDSVFMNNAAFLYEAADAIAKVRKLPEDWLNQSVARYVSGATGPKPNLGVFGEYPRDAGPPGLRVPVPAPEYLLAMKLIASRREDPAGAARDQGDIAHLMHVTGLRDAEALKGLVAEFYPRIPGIDHRVAAKIADALAYEKAHRSDVERRKTWNPRGGRDPGGRA